MQIVLAKVLGYCMGVRNAVEMTNRALDEYQDKKVYCLGPLIHNKIALSELEKKGLIIVYEDEIEKIENENVVVIRAHGVSPKVLKTLVEKKCKIINATCPRVVASQKLAEKYAKAGFDIILAGDKQHGEVVSIQGYAGDAFFLIENSNDAEKYCWSKKKSVLLSQTTFSPREFEKIATELSKKNDDLKIINTICPATKERQDSLLAICKDVDGILVVGGRNSANTKRLLETAKTNCKNATLIENANEIPENYFSMQKIGITAGASTPDNVIKMVVDKLKSQKNLL